MSLDPSSESTDVDLKRVTIAEETVETHSPEAVQNVRDRQAAGQVLKKPKRGILYSRFRPGDAV